MTKKRVVPLFYMGRFLFTAAVVLSLATQNIRAEQSRDSVVGYVRSSAQFIYNLAWPTATFKDYAIEDLRRKDQMYEVVIKLSGLSAIDGSDLWLRLGFDFDGSGLSDVKVLDHNAFWVAPFATIRGVARLSYEVAKQSAKSNPSPPIVRPVLTQADALCVGNTTETPLKFRYHWGSQPWTAATLGPKQNQQFWWTFAAGDGSSPGFYIEYDNSFDEGYTPQSYLLERNPAHIPIDCGLAKQYQFSTDGRNITLQSAN